MSAVERVQAAIGKLAEARINGAGWWAFEPDTTAIYRKDDEGWEVHVCDAVEQTDRDLILTLHRTIDTQLEILQEALRQASDPRFMFPFTGYDRAAIALADSILGPVAS